MNPFNNITINQSSEKTSKHIVIGDPIEARRIELMNRKSVALRDNAGHEESQDDLDSLYENAMNRFASRDAKGFISIPHTMSWILGSKEWKWSVYSNGRIKSLEVVQKAFLDSGLDLGSLEKLPSTAREIFIAIFSNAAGYRMKFDSEGDHFIGKIFTDREKVVWAIQDILNESCDEDKGLNWETDETRHKYRLNVIDPSRAKFKISSLEKLEKIAEFLVDYNENGIMIWRRY